MSIFKCPGTFPTIPDPTCENRTGQFIRIGITEYPSTAQFDTGVGATIVEEAAWDALVLADTIQYLPIPFGAIPLPKNTPAQAGGEDSVDGATKVTGRNPINVQFPVSGLDPAVYKSLLDLISVKKLGIYIFSSEGKVLSRKKEGGTTDNRWPIRLSDSSFYISSPGREAAITALNEHDVYFILPADWGDDYEIDNLEFNIRDKVNA